MGPLAVLAALTPIVAVFGLLVVLRMPAVRAMPISLAATAALAMAAWRVPPVHVAAAAIEGLFVAATILWIVFGAILLLRTVDGTGALDAIRAGFMRVTPDRRIQAIIIAWLFGAFMEGAAGFGSPAAVCAPLLVAVGFPPMAAVVLALIANSSPVSFGAVGTPVLIGIGQGLMQGGELAPAAVAAVGAQPYDLFLRAVAVRAVTIDLFAGSFVPLLICVVLTRFFGGRRGWRDGFAVWPFALLAGFAFTLPALAVAAFLGPEFPTMFGALVGLAIAVTAARRGFLMPRHVWDFDDAPGHGAPTSGAVVEGAAPQRTAPQRTAPERDARMRPMPPMPLLLAWIPYLLVGVLLVLTRLRDLPFHAWFSGARIEWRGILGTSIDASMAPLHLPGTVFLVVALCAALLQRADRSVLRNAVSETLGRVGVTAVALGAAVPMVRIFINSDVNAAGLESMPVELARIAADAAGGVWPAAAPFVGGLGSFISGSATFSNMMFALLQTNVAQASGWPVETVLAAQMLGANAGNMICVVNVVAAASVVRLLGREGTIIRYTLPASLLYLTVCGLGALSLGLMLGGRTGG
ncbi:MAG: L-lactate permease [Alphaproteobacteria bacterium]